MTAKRTLRSRLRPALEVLEARILLAAPPALPVIVFQPNLAGYNNNYTIPVSGLNTKTAAFLSDTGKNRVDTISDFHVVTAVSDDLKQLLAANYGGAFTFNYNTPSPNGLHITVKTFSALAQSASRFTGRQQLTGQAGAVIDAKTNLPPDVPNAIPGPDRKSVV